MWIYLSVTGMRRPHLSWVPEDTGQLLVAGGGAGGPGSAAAGRSSRRAGCTTHPHINPYPTPPTAEQSANRALFCQLQSKSAARLRDRTSPRSPSQGVLTLSCQAIMQAAGPGLLEAAVHLAYNAGAVMPSAAGKVGAPANRTLCMHKAHEGEGGRETSGRSSRGGAREAAAGPGSRPFPPGVGASPLATRRLGFLGSLATRVSPPFPPASLRGFLHTGCATSRQKQPHRPDRTTQVLTRQYERSN